MKAVQFVLHDAVFKDAQKKTRQNAENTATSVRLGECGPRAAAICQQNGTTISAFLRECCETLVKEYTEG